MLRNFIKYLVLLAALGLLSVLYNTYHMGILFLTMAVLPFFLFAQLCYLYGRLKAELLSEVHVAKKGEAIPVTVRLDNSSIFPMSGIKIYLTCRNVYSARTHRKKFLVSVDARTKANVTLNLYSEYAGNLEISLRSVRVFDYLRLFSLEKKKKDVLAAAVLPEYHELPEHLFSALHTGIADSEYYSAVRSGDDPSEVFSIREYREGDRIQRIHWKLSRKQDQLMIKEFSEPLGCSTLLFVDLCVPKGRNRLLWMDALTECALSLSYSMLLSGRLHYFAWYEEKDKICRRIRVSEEKDLFEAMDGLLRARPYASGTDALGAYYAEYPREQYSNMILVTGDRPEKYIQALSDLQAAVRQLVCLGYFHGDPDGNARDRLESEVPAAELARQLEDTGISLIPVNPRHVRQDLEA